MTKWTKALFRRFLTYNFTILEVAGLVLYTDKSITD